MKKILWASPNSLLDTTSGFALSVREMLFQLKKHGYEVKILSATIFDSPRGMTYINKYKEYMYSMTGKFIDINDENLTHITLVTKNTIREEMLFIEQYFWFKHYCRLLDTFKPNIVFYFRDGLLELEMGYQAKQRDMTTVVYIANGAYGGKRWVKDIDLLITDSIATSKLYKEKENYDVKPVGKFIPEHKYLAHVHSRKNILFINPELKKGALIVIQLAAALEKKRPDIIFEIVESRGNLNQLIEDVTKDMGQKRTNLANVIITKNTNDMKSIYSRARLLIFPSLYFESGGRVIVEAQINGIPALGSSSGGIPQMIGEGGIIFNFPKDLHKMPYNKILNKNSIKQITSVIERFYDDELYYQEYRLKALNNYKINHNIKENTKKLMGVLDSTIQIKNKHKQEVIK